MIEELKIEAAAELVITEQSISSLPIDPIAIANAYNIQVNPKPRDLGGASGHLFRIGDEFYILFSQNIDNQGFQKFSICHELGHYFLEGHVDQLFRDSDIHESTSMTSNDPFEREADAFAAALLMPFHLSSIAIKKFEDGLEGILCFQELCEASLTATARRYAKIADYEVAAVFSENGTIDYCVMSDRFKALEGLTWLKKGSPLPDTISASTMRQGDKLVCVTNLKEWFDGDPRYELKEEVIQIDKKCRKLSILSLVDFPEDEIDDYVEDVYSNYPKW